ncbi:MAG: hypothetical protein ABSD42_11305 [Candidatus Bathyarchaeia archaeon]|jgi:hypothetical protein
MNRTLSLGNANMIILRACLRPRMKVGSKQEFETLMNEEALLFTKYWEAKRKTGFPESEL